MSEAETNVLIPVSRPLEKQLRAPGATRKNYNRVLQELIQEHNRRQLGEYGAKLIREHKDEFVNIKELCEHE
ncbi:hypothetical protein [Methanosarcina siciliae]|uniref:hypothetical protein n=1 Tax=Methanosarcina siciliae TaxID=38027 RepID=UPI000A623186|nr:hypothetical protein [Methanosarcina siciliae]